MVDLKVRLQGDALEIELPPEITAGRFESWAATFQKEGRECKRVVFYDTIPRGTGYLRKFYENFPQIALHALQHLKQDPCATACYSCLKEFWNQRVHWLLNKQLVNTELEELAIVYYDETNRGIFLQFNKSLKFA